MKTSLFRPFAAALLLATPMFFASCSDDSDPEPEEDNEFITTIRYTLTPTSGGQAVTAEWRDIDGAGGTAPTITGFVLAPNTTYTGNITFSDETKSPAEDITEEIREEKEDHLVIYTTSASLMTITRTDKDDNGFEVGLATRVQTGAASPSNIANNLGIRLRHQPGTKNGTEAPGSDDANVTFPVVLQ